MKVLLENFKKPKFIILTVFFLLFLVLSPLSFHSGFFSGVDNDTKISQNSSSAETALDPTDPLSSLTSADLGGWDPGAIPGDPTKPVTNQPSSGLLVQIIKALAGYILNCIMAAIYLIMWVFYSIVYGLTSLSEKVLGLILDPAFAGKDYLGGFTTKDFVRSTAQLLANLCNMLYLFVLIYIAIKAMFGSSNTRGLLTKLVIAALLTNFGLVLAGVVIDFSQVIMSTVWEGLSRNNNGAFAPGTKILDKLQETLEVGRWGTLKSSISAEAYKMIFQDVGETLSQLIRLGSLILLALALIITLFTITVILFVRIVALWILLILTPVAFLFSILPQTEKYWNEWLESLTKYAFTGPILIFFLWLALKMSAGVSNVSRLNQIGQGAQNKEDLKQMFFALVAKNMTTIFEMFTLIITIWAGIIIANKFGIKGAKNLDGLIKSTGKWGRRLMVWPVGGAAKALEGVTKGAKVATWTGFRMKEKLREKDLKTMLSEKAAIEAQKGKDSREAIEKGKEITALEDKMKRARESKGKWLQRFARFSSPSLLKKSFSEYLKKNQEEYHGDMEKALKSYTNLFFNKGQRQELAAINSRTSLYDYQTDMNKLVDDLRKKEEEIRETKNNGEDTRKLEEERDVLKERIDFVAEGIAKKTTEDQSIQAKVKTSLHDAIFDQNNNLVEQAKIPAELIADTGKKLGVDMFNEAATLARKEALGWLKGEKNREAEAKKLKEAKEDIKKDDKFNPDFAIRQVLRGSVNKIEQKAIMEHLATSSTNFGKLVSAINKDQGNKENDVAAAMKFINGRLTEDDTVNILRIAEADANKTNNLTQLGWMTFDPVLGRSRITSKPEREQILEKVTSGWSVSKKIAKTHAQVFDAYDSGELKDPSAAKVLVRSVDWSYANSKPKIINNISEDITDRGKYLLQKNVTELEKFVNEPDKPDFRGLLLKLGSSKKAGGPQTSQPPKSPSQPNIILDSTGKPWRPWSK